jgi:trehalose 6-phosphate synthase
LAALGALVWIYNYPLQLVPDLIRRQRHDLRIGFFLHIPFPAPDTFRLLPGRDEVLRGILGADITSSCRRCHADGRALRNAPRFMVSHSRK